MRIIDTLMSGVVGTERWGVDEAGKVFVLDEKGKPQQEVFEPIATKVREAIQRVKERAMPQFEPAAGNCEFPKCVNPAKHRVLWPNASKLVCENHKSDLADKSWPDVSRSFGNNAKKG
jgi:hypothetical protein